MCHSKENNDLVVSYSREVSWNSPGQDRLEKATEMFVQSSYTPEST
jgi:hypothetical protein